MRAPRKLVAPVLLITLLAAACTPGTSKVIRQPLPNADTTIVVVVDDFGSASDDSVGKADSNAGGTTDNCAYAGIPSNDVESYGGTNQSPPPTTSHGEMVASVLLNELTSRQGNVAPDTIAPYGSAAIGYTGSAKRWVSDDLLHELVLEKVHVKRYKTEQLIQRVGRILDDATFEHVVVNMSFIVAPCDVAGWFADDSPDAQKLLDLYNGKNGTKKKLDDLQQLLTGMKQPVAEWSKELGDFVRFMAGVDYDPIRRQLASDPAWDGFKKKHNPSSKPSVVGVGAAGNGIAYHDGATIRTERMPVPFIPAGWPGVLSVSATDGLTSYSNDAEYQFDGRMIDSSGIPWKGTSFASPRLAAQLALFQYKGGSPPDCAAGLDYNDLLRWAPDYLFTNKVLVQPNLSDCPHT